MDGGGASSAFCYQQLPFFQQMILFIPVKLQKTLVSTAIGKHRKCDN
jgi:hypothetical protein